MSRPEKMRIRLRRRENQIEAVIGDIVQPVDRVARAFPRSNPDRFVGLLGEDGHEICLIEDPGSLDADSQVILKAALKDAYFIPRIREILSMSPRGTGGEWTVVTEEGEIVFRTQDREALDGSEPPSITVTDENGRRYRIEDYWAMDRESRNTMRDLVPDEVLRRRARVVSLRR
ncbi:MAG: DUF1854 domain-containing protein [Gemmatimonadota bacterium]|nr:DUF1854 domain-containing protein [Gemmatimonadota bacterium]